MPFNIYIYIIIVIIYLFVAFLWNKRFNKERKLLENRLNFYNEEKVIYQFFYRARWGGSWISLILTDKNLYSFSRIWLFGYYLGKKWALDINSITNLSIKESNAKNKPISALTGKDKMFSIKFSAQNKTKKAKIIGVKEAEIFLSRLKKLNKKVIIKK